jgi:hypothetical protein
VGARRPRLLSRPKKEDEMRQDEKMLKPGDKVFSTKYVLTCGIVEKKVKSVSEGGYVYTFEPSLRSSLGLQHNAKEWHLTRAEAVARAITVIDAKIKSLDKSRTKMLALRDTLSTEHQS